MAGWPAARWLNGQLRMAEWSCSAVDDCPATYCNCLMEDDQDHVDEAKIVVDDWHGRYAGWDAEELSEKFQQLNLKLRKDVTGSVRDASSQPASDAVGSDTNVQPAVHVKAMRWCRRWTSADVCQSRTGEDQHSTRCRPDSNSDAKDRKSAFEHTVTFEPGLIGVSYDEETGEITRVHTDSAAECAGVRDGYTMTKIDGFPFSSLEYRAAKTRRRKITFSSKDFTPMLEEVCGAETGACPLRSSGDLDMPLSPDVQTPSKHEHASGSPAHPTSLVAQLPTPLRGKISMEDAPMCRFGAPEHNDISPTWTWPDDSRSLPGSGECPGEDGSQEIDSAKASGSPAPVTSLLAYLPSPARSGVGLDEAVCSRKFQIHTPAAEQSPGHNCSPEVDSCSESSAPEVLELTCELHSKQYTPASKSAAQENGWNSTAQLLFFPSEEPAQRAKEELLHKANATQHLLKGFMQPPADHSREHTDSQLTDVSQQGEDITKISHIESFVKQAQLYLPELKELQAMPDRALLNEPKAFAYKFLREFDELQEMLAMFKADAAGCPEDKPYRLVQV